MRRALHVKLMPISTEKYLRDQLQKARNIHGVAVALKL